MLVLLLLLIATPAWGIDGNPVTESTTTVSSSAVSLTDCGNFSDAVLLQVLDAQIYYRLDDETATPDSSDYLGYIGDVLTLQYPRKFRAIRVSGDAKVHATCFQ